MAQIYFSKFNINSEIYKVYDDDGLKDKILKEVFEKIDENTRHTEREKRRGEEEKEVTYKFCNLIKNSKNKVICGRLVKIYEGEIQSYDAKNDTVITSNANNCAASSTFYFDLKSEEIAFITRNALGYNQFNKYFKALVEKYFEDITFEIFLENNIGELKEKLYAMSRILSVEAVIIPPNANRKDFARIFGPSEEEVRESGATKVISKMEVSAKSKNALNIGTSYFDRILLAIKKGYASLVAKGRDENNENCTVTSEEDASYKATISDKEKDDLEYFSIKAENELGKLLKSKQSEDDDDEEEN